MPPAPDRLLTVLVDGTGDYDDSGRYIQGPDVEHRVWGWRRDDRVGYDLNPSGARNEVQRTYRIRWHSAIADVSPIYLNLTDGTTNADGSLVRFNVNRLVEITGRDFDLRRRWLELTALKEIT